MKGQAVVRHQGRPIIAPGEALRIRIFLEHPVQGDDMGPFGLGVGQTRVTLIARRDRAKNYLDARRIRHFRHLGDIRHNLLLGHTLCQVVGTRHNDGHYGIEVHDILLETGEHLGRILAADALIQIPVGSKEARMETGGDIVTADGHIGRARVDTDENLALVVRAGRDGPLPSDAVADKNGIDAAGCI